MKKTILLVFVLGCFAVLLTACTKDQIINKYHQAMQLADKGSFFQDIKLPGQHGFSADSYLGSYSAEYRQFTGREILFGGTALEREAGEEITITCTFKIKDGSAQLVFLSGAGDPQSLLDQSADDRQKLILPSKSNYVVLSGRGLTGSVDLNIENGTSQLTQ